MVQCIIYKHVIPHPSNHPTHPKITVFLFAFLPSSLPIHTMAPSRLAIILCILATLIATTIATRTIGYPAMRRDIPICGSPKAKHQQPCLPAPSSPYQRGCEASQRCRQEPRTGTITNNNTSQQWGELCMFSVLELEGKGGSIRYSFILYCECILIYK